MDNDFFAHLDAAARVANTATGSSFRPQAIPPLPLPQPRHPSTRNVALPPGPTFDSAPTPTPVMTNDESLQLNCLIEGESVVFPVIVSDRLAIGLMKEFIQSERAQVLRDIDACTLELWKPKDANPIIAAPEKPLADCIRSQWDSLSKFADELEPTDKLFRIFPEQPPDELLHIIVRIPDTELCRLGKRSREVAEENTISALQEKQTKRYRTGESPSTVCKDAKSMKSRQDYAEILNGRPWTSSGPPVGLYHPVFDSFCEYFNKSTPVYRTASSADPDESTFSADDAFSFMRASSQFYDVEKSWRVDENSHSGRMEAVRPAFSRLLGITLPGVVNAGGTEVDAMAMVKTPAGDDGPLAVVDIKLESGIGGDAKLKAQQSYARMCSLTAHEPVRSSCCSPCFLVVIEGPWITVLGAVYVHKVIVQHLAGPIYLSPQTLHPQSTIDKPLRLFYALRRALRDLRQYYERLPRSKSFSRFFPFVQSYTPPNGETINFDYVAPLLPEALGAIYSAKLMDGREVVVKFPLTYNGRAHRLLAKHGLAPELIYDGAEGLLYGGLHMIVMEYVKGKTLSKFLQQPPHRKHLDAIIPSVKQAIALLHGENLVFGDLRTPNILVDDQCHVKLIDYDWCGDHGVHKYPFIIGDAIEWASGVGPLATMHKDHDIYMLEQLEARLRAGILPGYW